MRKYTLYDTMYIELMQPELKRRSSIYAVRIKCFGVRIKCFKYKNLMYCIKCLYAHNFENIALVLSVGASVQKKVRVLKFHKWIPHQNIADPYFILF